MAFHIYKRISDVFTKSIMQVSERGGFIENSALSTSSKGKPRYETWG